MTNKKRFAFTLLILGTIIITGFTRDFIFKSINGLLKAWDTNQYYYLHPSINFLETAEYSSLIKLKWLLTFLFTTIFFLITLFTIRVFFNKKKKYRNMVLLSYASLITISAICYLSGFVLGSTESTYEFARYLMGMAQSPIVLMILIPLLVFMEKENVNSQ